MPNVIGTYAESAFHGLKVYESDGREEAVYFQWFYGDKPDSRITKATLRMTARGRLYFKTRGHRVYLDEVLRIA